MRKLLAGLVLTAAVVIPPVSLAVPVLASAPHTCTSNYHGQVTLGASRLWLTNVSGCRSGYPVFYNRTQCIYNRVVGTFWYDGPQRTGNGSSTSNYSGVVCRQYPYPSVTQVWIWVNGGGGWAGKRVF